MKYDFINQVSVEEHMLIAHTLWKIYQKTRTYGELENKNGLALEGVECYLRFVKSIREVPIVKFENVFEEDGSLENSDVYHVSFSVSKLVAIVVHDMGSDDWYVSNSGDQDLHEFMLANF